MCRTDTWEGYARFPDIFPSPEKRNLNYTKSVLSAYSGGERPQIIIIYYGGERVHALKNS